MVAANRHNRQIILGECKWKSNVNIDQEAAVLMSKSHLLADYSERHYYLFTKSMEREKKNTAGTNVITAEMLYRLDS